MTSFKTLKASVFENASYILWNDSTAPLIISTILINKFQSPDKTGIRNDPTADTIFKNAGTSVPITNSAIAEIIGRIYVLNQFQSSISTGIKVPVTKDEILLKAVCSIGSTVAAMPSISALKESD